MRSPLPIFIFIGLALIAVIGLITLQYASTSASIEVNNTTSEPVATDLYEIDYGIIFGIAALIMLVAVYFALKMFI